MPLAFVALAGMISSSCDDDDQSTWEKYAEWRNANKAFYEEQKFKLGPDGSEYTPIVPSWNSGAEVLIKYLNDRSKTEGNLSPMLTSTVTVKYIGRLYNGEAFDSSYTKTDSNFTTGVSEVIAGWTTALQYMRVGDSARVVIPYGQAYGASGSGAIPPYSTLVFDIKLKNINDYEVKP